MIDEYLVRKNFESLGITQKFRIFKNENIKIIDNIPIVDTTPNFIGELDGVVIYNKQFKGDIVYRGNLFNTLSLSINTGDYIENKDGEMFTIIKCIYGKYTIYIEASLLNNQL